MEKKFFTLVFVFSICIFSLFSMIDLEERLHDSVIETRQLFIPGFPDAFNPSVVEWEGAYLMSFRFRDPLTKATNQVGFVRLNERFEIEGSAEVLRQNFAFTSSLWTQDPRLIVVNGEIYMVFNNLGELEDRAIRRTLIGKIDVSETGFSIDRADLLLRFEQENPRRHEKNWTPFVFQNQLLLIYSICPHKIFLPYPEENRCETIASTKSSVKWDWGTLRGGTPATREGDEYLSFFHTCKRMATVHSEGKFRDHYFMGAYTFSSEPPFHITRISPEPIVGKNFYVGKLHRTWKPLHVVFPGGHISGKKFIRVVYGRQDHEIWIAKIDRKKLIDSLVPVLPP